MRLVASILRFYADGFRAMTTGRRLWWIILIKLAIIFLVFRLFFFPDFLKSRYETETERSGHVVRELTTIKN